DKLLLFRKERNWKQFHRPKELAAAISIESSELQELFLWREQENSDEILLDRELIEKIEDEIADIQIYLLFLTHDLGLNLREIVRKKILKNEEKYPAEEYYGRFKK
nr:nucleotide pyrophosphohydrolase [Candidatus Thorarchaeota archaeon]NIW14147.1 nucleotide pyrophosphohydrolase [Candidatus Thorarchaeota archaeon]NIW52250.1 nucleotide pyrophosphohydrolase [Candidatus Korarchaeota archaeon]